MSEIGESLAEVGQGILTAHAVEPASGSGDGHSHETACLNCGTMLVGQHCHACGQAAHVHRTLGAFFHDLLHGVFHFEGKIWRTLPLLVWRPGKLTREYIEGKRASYVSPIALFLFCVFLMFAVFHATESKETAGDTVFTDMDSAIVAQEKKVGELKDKRAQREAAGKSIESVSRRLAEEEGDLATLRQLKRTGVGQMPHQGTYSDIPQVDKAIKTFRADPALAMYKAQTYAYKYSWALIPISVPFLWLLFPFSRRFHLYDHTVFVTYSLSFMTLLVIASMLAGVVGVGGLGGLLFFVPPFHMYRQLRGAYALGRFGALWRTVLLVGFAGTALLIFFILIMAQTRA